MTRSDAAPRDVSDPDRSDLFGDHRYRTAGALGGAHRAALAVVVFEFEALAWSELRDGVVGADAVAVVAFEAIAAG